MSGYERALREAVRGWLQNCGVPGGGYEDSMMAWLGSDDCKMKFVNIVEDEIAQYRKEYGQSRPVVVVQNDTAPKPVQKKFEL